MFILSMTGRYRFAQAGISLIELIMFMVIVSVGLAGILSVMTVTTRASADPMLRKQAIAIAESLLEEIQLQPFTFCDPDDPQAATATAAVVGAPGAGCTAANTIEGFGAGALESRGSTTAPYDNVYDYSGTASGTSRILLPSPPGIVALNNVNTAITGLEAYSATVTITQEAVGPFPVVPADTVPAAASLRIDVQVRSGNNVDVTLTGYRMRYAPNATP
jgi:MSHA pilin protein MshD